MEKHKIADNRKEAKAKGYSRYFGDRCRHGHDGVRYTSNGTCFRCSKDRKNKRAFKDYSVSIYNRRIDIDHKKDEYDFDADYYGD